MTCIHRYLLVCLLSSIALMANAFAPTSCLANSNRLAQQTVVASSSSSPTLLKATPLEVWDATTAATASTSLVSAATLDPTTFLSDILGGFLNSNLILAVPIIAALGVAGLISWGIIAYANPAEPDDEY